MFMNVLCHDISRSCRDFKSLPLWRFCKLMFLKIGLQSHINRLRFFIFACHKIDKESTMNVQQDFEKLSLISLEKTIP